MFFCVCLVLFCFVFWFGVVGVVVDVGVVVVVVVVGVVGVVAVDDDVVWLEHTVKIVAYVPVCVCVCVCVCVFCCILQSSKHVRIRTCLRLRACVCV